MEVSSCDGRCCAVFHWPSKPSEMRARVEANTPGDLEVGATTGITNGPDDLMIADMLVPLTIHEAADRADRFGINKKLLPAENLYTCRHWNEETRECGVYDARPVMCASYPYGKKCAHCDCEGGCEQKDWKRPSTEA